MHFPYNQSQIETILREVESKPPFPPASDRAAWSAVQDRDLIRQAELAAGQAIPALPASLWLECQRTGWRKGYEDPCYKRRTLMRDLVLGECLEYRGRFLDPLMDVIWAICEESSWAYPAHHTQLADMDRPYIDLGAAGTAFELAEVYGLIGPALPPEVGRRIWREIDQRVFSPYLARDDFWWLRDHPGRPVNNWTAVCSAGVMGAALALEPDPARLAAILAKGVRSLEEYLATFDEDGGTSEGVGYWCYGFGWYTLIAQRLEQRTDGKITLMDGELIRKIAAFPLGTMLSQGSFVNFSDAPRRAQLVSAMLTYLGRRLEMPGLLDLARDPANRVREELNADLYWLLPTLFWDLPEPEAAPVTLARRDWYSGMMWMIARSDPTDPDALVLAAKGGHNDEMHNHNDLGTFIVQVNQEAVIADIGCGQYTLQYFGEERYDLLVTSSKGHPVPVPNGQFQPAGRQFAARVLEHSWDEDQDVLRLDLSAAYPPEANLKTLERRLALHRQSSPEAGCPSAWVELEDRFAFQDGPGTFESALTTFGQVEVGAGLVLLQGERGSLQVRYPAESAGVRVEVYPAVAFSDGPRDVNRVVFFLLEPRQQGEIRLEIEKK